MLPAILMAPHTAMYVWCWVSYMNPHRNSWSFVKEAPLLDAVAAFTMVAWLTSKDRKVPEPHPVLFVMLGLFLWTCLTTIFAVNPNMAVNQLTRFAKIILFTIFAMVFITSKDRIRYFIYVILLGLGFYSVKGGIFTILNGGQYIVFGPAKTFLADNNQLALACLTVCPLFYWVGRHGETKLIRLGAMASGVLTLISVLGSQSRGSIIALTGMIAWMCIVGRKIGLGIVLGVSLLGGALLFMPEEWLGRMESIAEYEEDSSATSRRRMWKYATNVANARPLIGGGFEFYYHRPYADKYMPGGGKIYVAHSNYFDSLGQHGYVGLFLYLLLFSCAFVSATEVRRLTKGQEDLAWAFDLGHMLQFSLIGFGIGGAFLSLSTFDLYFHIVALTMVLHCLIVKQVQPEKTAFNLKDLTGRPANKGALPAE